jgi:two-component system, OmpR family, response regulator
MRLLLVEDDLQLSESLVKALKHDGFSLLAVTHGRDAINNIAVEHIDIVVLDIGLPDMDGIKVLKHIRAKKFNCKVIILTARDQLSDKVTGLDAGADDYLVKPFEYDELAARIRVLERSLTNRTQTMIEVGSLKLDPNGHVVHLDNQQLDFSKKEYLLLKSLMESAGRVQTKEALEAKLYDYGEEVMSNAIEVHIHHIRKKLPKETIKTIRGIGYTIRKP